MKTLLLFINCYLSTKTNFCRYSNKELAALNDLKKPTSFDRKKESVISNALSKRFEQEELEQLCEMLYLSRASK
jgi:hypothetical protein